MNEQPAASGIDVRRALRILRRRKSILIATILVLPLAAYTFSDRENRVYSSSVLLQISAPPDVSQLLTAAAVVPDTDATQAAARLVSTTAVATQVAETLGLPRSSARGLLGTVTVTGEEIGGFLTISARAGSPPEAARIANAFAETIVARRGRATASRFEAAIAQLRADLDNLPRSDRDARRQLSQDLQRLRALRAAQGNNAQIIEPAVANPAAISPRPKRTAALAFIVSLLLAAGLILLVENVDRRVRQANELEELTGLPLLALLPKSAFGASLDSAAHQQQFQMLRAGLTYFNIDRTLSSVMVTSGSQGEGKTTVASNLAYAFARAGRNVVLVDADLRRPRVHSAFNLSNLAGLGSVIVDDKTLDEVLTAVEVRGATGGGSLRVLPAGPTPPNSSELLASERMRAVLDELKEQADLLVIDTSPVLAVSDALPLVEQVGGVVVVARLNETTRDATLKLLQLLNAARGKIFGVVATGAKQADGYGYGYGYSADQPSRGKGLLGKLGRPKPKDDVPVAAGSEEVREPVKVGD